MFLKYPNNEFSHIFNSDIDKKLKILEQLASQNKVAKKYYNAIVSNAPYCIYVDYYTQSDLAGILRIESALNLLSDIIDEDIIICCHTRFTIDKLKNYHGENLPLKDYALFNIIKECKNIGIPEKIENINPTELFRQIIPIMNEKEKKTITHLLLDMRLEVIPNTSKHNSKKR